MGGRITKMAEEKLMLAMDNLGILRPERELISHEIVPVAMPAGTPGDFLLAVMIFVDMPTVDGQDHVEHHEVLQFPFATQPVYDELLGKLLSRVRAERNEVAGLPADALPATQVPPGQGLIVPGRQGAWPNGRRL